VYFLYFEGISKRKVATLYLLSKLSFFRRLDAIDFHGGVVVDRLTTHFFKYFSCYSFIYIWMINVISSVDF